LARGGAEVERMIEGKRKDETQGERKNNRRRIPFSPTLSLDRRGRNGRDGPDWVKIRLSHEKETLVQKKRTTSIHPGFH